MDTEARLLKNRLRQQRYRARRREEKVRRDGSLNQGGCNAYYEETTSLMEPTKYKTPNFKEELPCLRHDVDSSCARTLQPIDQTKTGEANSSCKDLTEKLTAFGNGATGKVYEGSEQSSVSSYDVHYVTEMDCPRSQDEIEARRLKNRERQRRYRAKKRLEAYKTNTHPSNQLVSTQTEPQNGSAFKFVARVHCTRNWKKDARRAHSAKAPEDMQIVPIEELSCGVEVHLNNPPSSSSHRETGGRRHWKADARNKVDSTASENQSPE
ncbi:hypothetical protein QJS10_CPA10g01172 [Acorus calamus]|uniref:BZIP domain-containing protein n=1 Tax=Acorus calamus TaxID=4465 RepID=A0AAV9E055_ACOCL|nr:hypothetical protein QJS10_CPA10g01172 [Acorus calamus]